MPCPAPRRRLSASPVSLALPAQVVLAPFAVGSCSASLIVHAAADGGASSLVAVCDLRGSCTKSPLLLSRPHAEDEPEGAAGGPTSLRVQNISADPVAVSISADAPFALSSPAALTLHAGEAHVVTAVCEASDVPVPELWLTVRDTTHDNAHRVSVSNAAHVLGPSPPAQEVAAASALSSSLAVRGTEKWILAGVASEIDVEVRNEATAPVRIAPRLRSSDATTAAVELKQPDPVLVAPLTSAVFKVCFSALETGAQTFELELLCHDDSSVVVPLKVHVEDEAWEMGESDTLDFGCVDSAAVHAAPVQIRNRSRADTPVQVFVDNAGSGAMFPRCFSLAIDKTGSSRLDGDKAGADGPSTLERGEILLLPPCTENDGVVTLHVLFDAADIVDDKDHLAPCTGLLRVQSVATEEGGRSKTVQLRAATGRPRLQVPNSEQLLLFCVDDPGQGECEQQLNLRNAGGVAAACTLATTDSSFRVAPQTLEIGPLQSSQVTVTFLTDHAGESPGSAAHDTATGHLNISTTYEFYQIPLRAEVRTHPHLVCSAPVVNWGCVDLGTTQRQSILVRNRSNFGCEIFAAIADLEGPPGQDCPFSIEGADAVLLNAHDGHEIVVSFTPKEVSFVRQGLFIRDKHGRTYKIPLLGAGGRSNFTLEVGHGAKALDFGDGKRAIHKSTVKLQNNGTRTGFVHVDCTSTMAQVAVQGAGNAASVIIAPNKSHEFELVQTSPGGESSHELTLDVYCGDELARRRRRQCRHTRWAEDLGFSGFAPGRDAFDDTFCNEEFFVEPSQSRAASPHEDTMFDDYFDEPIFEAQLRRFSVPVICRAAPMPDVAAEDRSASQRQEQEEAVAEEEKGEEEEPSAQLPATSPSEVSSEVSQSRAVLRSTSNVVMNGERPAKPAVQPPKRRDAPRHPETLHLGDDHESACLEFPATSLGASTTVQLELCNGHRHKDVTCVVLDAKAPFVVRHQRFRIRSRSRIRLPVRFAPGETAPSHPCQLLRATPNASFATVRDGNARQLMRIETTGQEQEAVEISLVGEGV